VFSLVKSFVGDIANSGEAQIKATGLSTLPFRLGSSRANPRIAEKKTTLPSEEILGTQPGDKTAGVGALPGLATEQGVAVLPDEKSESASTCRITPTIKLITSQPTKEHSLEKYWPLPLRRPPRPLPTEMSAWLLPSLLPSWVLELQRARQISRLPVFPPPQARPPVMPPHCLPSTPSPARPLWRLVTCPQLDMPRIEPTLLPVSLLSEADTKVPSHLHWLTPPWPPTPRPPVFRKSRRRTMACPTPLLEHCRSQLAVRSLAQLS
jgi:hypothetical protein